MEIKFFKDIYRKYKKNVNNQNYKIVTYQIIRDSIDLMIKDLIDNTKKNLIKNNIRDNGIAALLIYKVDEKIQSFESKQWKELLQ